MQKLPRALRKIGGIGLLLLLVFAVYFSKVLQPLDRIIYDAQIRFAERVPLQDIVIIGIDKPSLDTLGRWPWPRDIHARFIDKISKAKPKSVVMDILFSEPGIPKNDQLLAQAIANNGKVILPVAFELSNGNLNLTENLPIPPLLNAAAGIGHVDRELDIDTVSRRSYLYAGLSRALQWPSIALESIWVAGENPERYIPENYLNSARASISKKSYWTRSEEYLLPFAGKPGKFERISYASVLTEDFNVSRLNDKFVVIGTLAIGLGDVVPTPVSGEGSPMAGVEVIANEIDSLRQELMISELSGWPILLMTLVAVLISFLLWDFLPPRYSLSCVLGLILLILASDAWLLHKARLWFPPANLIIGVTIGYLVWVWGRLVQTVKYLNSELDRLGDVSMPLLDMNPQDGNKAFNYLMKIDGFCKGLIKDHQGQTLFEWKTNVGEESIGNNKDMQLTNIEMPVDRQNGNWQLSIVIDENKIHKDDATQIAKQLTNSYAADFHNKSKTPVEFINSRIRLVRTAYSKIHSMNDFISEVLDQLYNGVVVTDAFGNAVMANRASNKLLDYGKKLPENLSVLEILAKLEFNKNIDWHKIFSRVMFKNEEFIVEAKTTPNHHLLVEVTRYTIDNKLTFGMVFNFIDVTALKETEKSRRELLAFLSHDLRSPLASLIATTDLAKLKPEYRESGTYLESIKGNAKRALQLADDFLALMRAENVSDESFKPVCFNTIVAESVASVEDFASAKKISITQLINDEELYVRGDKSVLERVMINLLSNAVKYSPTHREIEVGILKQNHELYCFVKDNGYGIREEDKEKVFQRFERLNHAGNRDNPGTGLGLAFVKSSIERHKGRIHLESKEGEGSCFQIYLPLLTEKSKIQDVN